MTLLDQLDHHSPSKTNMWVAAPGLCVLRYFGGVVDERGPAPIRGNAVEEGMKQVLHGQPLDDAIAVALANFEQNMLGEISDEIEAERKLIPGMVKQCAIWTQSHSAGMLLGTQLRIEHRMDGLTKPFIGYVDFSFELPDVDCKSTKACPSNPKADHSRQVALYSAARNKPAGLLYVTDKKHAYYQLDAAAIEASLNEMHAAALSLERFLSRFSEAEDAIRCLPIDRDNFRFSEAAKQKLEELHL